MASPRTSSSPSTRPPAVPLARPPPVHPGHARSTHHHAAPQSTRSSVHSIRSLPTSAPRPHSTYTTHSHTLSHPRPVQSSSRHHSDSSGHGTTDSDRLSRSKYGWKASYGDSSDTDVYHSTYSDEDYEDENATANSAKKIGQALLHLSLTAPFLSIAITLYTIIILLYSLLAAPLRLFIKSRPTLRFGLASHLARPLRLQLRCVHAPTSRAVVYDEKTMYSHQRWPSDHLSLPAKSDLADRLGSLILTHLFAPIFSLPILFSAWVVLIFWALSAVINDEGTSGDGKSLALTVIDWWRWYLEGRLFR